MDLGLRDSKLHLDALSGWQDVTTRYGGQPANSTELMWNGRLPGALSPVLATTVSLCFEHEKQTTDQGKDTQ